MRKIGDLVKCYCNRCQKQTNHKILSIKYDPKVGDEDFICEESYQIVKCLGCDNYEFRREYIDYENERYNFDEIFPKYAVNAFNPREVACIPSAIYNLYCEIKRAILSESMLLAGMGLRSLTESIANDLKIRCKKLQSKITKMKNMGFITEKQCSMLHEIRFLGNDATHDAFSPNKRSVNFALGIIETLIKQSYIQPQLAKYNLPKSINYNDFRKIVISHAKCFSKGSQKNIGSLLPQNQRNIEDVDEFTKKLLDEIKDGKIAKFLHIPSKNTPKLKDEIIQIR